MATYLLIDNVKGDLRLKNYENWIKVTDLKWGFSSLNGGGGADAGLGVSRQKYNAFNVTQYADSSLTDILKLIKPDKTIPTIKAVYTDTDDNDALVYMSLKWSNCQIHGLSQVKYYGDNAIIEYPVTYTKFEIKTIFYDANGAAQSQKIASYDVEKGVWG